MEKELKVSKVDALNKVSELIARAEDADSKHSKTAAEVAASKKVYADIWSRYADLVDKIIS